MKRNKMEGFLSTMGIIVLVLGGVGSLIMAAADGTPEGFFMYLIAGALSTCALGGALLGIAEVIKIVHFDSERLKVLHGILNNLQSKNLDKPQNSNE